MEMHSLNWKYGVASLVAFFTVAAVMFGPVSARLEKHEKDLIEDYDFESRRAAQAPATDERIRSIVRDEVSIVRDEVSIVRDEVSIVRDEVSTVREEMNAALDNQQVAFERQMAAIQRQLEEIRRALPPGSAAPAPAP